MKDRLEEKRVRHKRALVLNADMLPLAVTHWNKAIQKHYQGLMDVVDFYKDDYILCSSGTKHPVPAVIRSRTYISPKSRRISFSKANLCVRDNMMCQYCGLKFLQVRDVTLDHVLPRSVWKNKGIKGSPTNWGNIVIACAPCNKRKANRTPGQADMALLNKPRVPQSAKYILGLKPWHRIEPEWEPYVKIIWKDYQIRDHYKTKKHTVAIS